MGSLFSPPKPQPVYIPQPVYVPPSPAPVAATPAPMPAPDKSEAAPPSASQLGLLERSRGILSTVLTGFDGILTKSTTPQGKSLLGE